MGEREGGEEREGGREGGREGYLLLFIHASMTCLITSFNFSFQSMSSVMYIHVHVHVCLPNN